jgi:hypothetical protein
MTPDAELFDAALHLFGLFFENPPPTPDARETWQKLERIALGMYRRTAHPRLDPRGRPADAADSWPAIRRGCARCLPLLAQLDREDRLVRRAYVYLARMVDALDQCLQATAPPSS